LKHISSAIYSLHHKLLKKNKCILKRNDKGLHYIINNKDNLTTDNQQASLDERYKYGFP